MYFIYGNENFLIWNEVKKHTKNKLEKIVIFNEENDIYEVINEIESYDLFKENKIIIIKNFYLLKKNDKKISDLLIDVLKNKNIKYKIIFTLEEEKIDKHNLLINFLIQEAKFIKIKKYTSNELINVIKNIVNSKNAKISHEAIIEFLLRIPNDLRIILQEINKLLLTDNIIEKNTIELKVSNYYENDAFELLNELNKMNLKNIYSTLLKKIINYEDINLIIGQISSHFNLSLLIYVNLQLGKNLNYVGNKYKIHKFRLTKANDFLEKLGIEKIKYLINKIAILDNDIKNGYINEILGIKNFILDLFKIENNL